jgi:hydroxymethylpyrimidine/phosphomethylpyrimidine kinase
MDLHHTCPDEVTRLVVVGGLDPGGGAGVLRDFSTAAALGAHARVVVTSLTEQDAASVTAVEPRQPEQLRHALANALARSYRPGVKIGMVATEGVALAIAEALVGFEGPAVYDPVLRASSGGWLYEGSMDAVIGLARKVTVLTPNLGEAAWLLGRTVADLTDARSAARDLVALGIPAVLVKGGHLSGDADDVLLDGDGETIFTGPRIEGPSPRGTGCTLATAIAVGLTRGEDLRTAIGTAKGWLTERIAAAKKISDEWQL